MVEKGYDAVTVQHIIDRANVGRSTFYAHYDGKEDLLRSGMKNLSKQLLGYQRAALALKGSFRERGFAFALVLFEHANGHRDTYHAIVGKHSGAVVMDAMRALLAELVRNELNAYSLNEEKSKLSPAEASAIFRRLTIPAILGAGDSLVRRFQAVVG